MPNPYVSSTFESNCDESTIVGFVSALVREDDTLDCFVNLTLWTSLNGCLLLDSVKEMF